MRVLPIGRRLKTTSTLMFGLKEEGHNFMHSGIFFYFLLLTRKREDHLFGYLSKIYILIGLFKWEWRIFLIRIGKIKYLLPLSATSFPRIPTWAGAQQKRTVLWQQEIQNSHSYTFGIDGWKLRFLDCIQSGFRVRIYNKINYFYMLFLMPWQQPPSLL